MSGTLEYLTRQEHQALQILVERLRNRFGEYVVDVQLFGSKARGDFGPHSDLDVLVILNTEEWEIEDKIGLLAARVSLEYDVLINMHFVTTAHWRAHAQAETPYWRHVQEEGVCLLPA